MHHFKPVSFVSKGANDSSAPDEGSGGQGGAGAPDVFAETGRHGLGFAGGHASAGGGRAMDDDDEEDEDWGFATASGRRRNKLRNRHGIIVDAGSDSEPAGESSDEEGVTAGGVRARWYQRDGGEEGEPEGEEDAAAGQSMGSAGEHGGLGWAPPPRLSNVTLPGFARGRREALIGGTAVDAVAAAPAAPTSPRARRQGVPAAAQSMPGMDDSEDEGAPAPATAPATAPGTSMAPSLLASSKTNETFARLVRAGVGASAPAQAASSSASDVTPAHAAHPAPDAPDVPDVPDAPDAPAADAAPKRVPARLDAEFGKFEKHTKGIGLKLLRKWGFQGRMGKHEQGIANPIAVKVRPKNLGLQFGGFREAAQLRQNKEFDRDFRGEAGQEEGGDAAQRRGKRDRAGRKRGLELPFDPLASATDWRVPEREAAADESAAAAAAAAAGSVGGSRKRARRYVTSAELLASMGTAAGSEERREQVIVDMRGPNVRLLSSLTEAGQDARAAAEEAEEARLAAAAAAAADEGLGRELLHNMRYLVEREEVALRTAKRKLDEQQRHALAVQAERGKLQQTQATEQARLARMETIVRLVQRCAQQLAAMREAEALWARQRRARVAERPGSGDEGTADGAMARSVAVPPGTLLQVFEVLSTQYAVEYARFGIVRLAFPLLRASFAHAVHAWDPLAAPAQVLGELEPWRTLLEDGAQAMLRQGGLGTAVQADVSRATFSAVVEDVVLPRVRDALAGHAWQVWDPQPAVRLLLALRDMVSESHADALGQLVVLPRLQRELAAWDPTARQAAPLHSWLLPWQPVLGAATLAALHPAVRQKLAAWLAGWHPGDPAARAALLPWRGVFDDASMTALLVRAVMPKLVKVLREELVVDPGNQDIRPFRWVMAWADVLPLDHAASLLEGEFFPKWSTVLHTWLSSGAADFEEVMQWYQGWKGEVPALLQSDTRVQACFGAALRMMNTAATAPDELPALQPSAASYGSALAQRHAADRARRAETDAAQEAEEAEATARASATAAAAGAGAERGGAAVPPLPDLTFREVVEIFAERHGLALVPNAKRGRQDGKQVYSLGALNVYLDGGVVFAESLQQRGTWRPVALERVVEVERQARGGR